MKLELRLLLMLFAIGFGACAPSQYASKSFHDDLYYTPSSVPENIAEAQKRRVGNFADVSNEFDREIQNVPTPGVSDADINDTSGTVDYRNYQWVASDTIVNEHGSPVVQNFYAPVVDSWDYMNLNPYSGGYYGYSSWGPSYRNFSFGVGYYNPWYYDTWGHCSYYDPWYNNYCYGWSPYSYPGYSYYPSGHVIVGGGSNVHVSKPTVRGGRARAMQGSAYSSSRYQGTNTNSRPSSTIVSGRSATTYGRSSATRSSSSTTRYRPSGSSSTSSTSSRSGYKPSSSSYPKYGNTSRGRSSATQSYSRPRSSRVSGYRPTYNSNSTRSSGSRSSYSPSRSTSNTRSSYSPSRSKSTSRSSYTPSKSSSRSSYSPSRTSSRSSYTPSKSTSRSSYSPSRSSSSSYPSYNSTRSSSSGSSSGSSRSSSGGRGRQR
ncbi:hypothetical protein OAT16_10175 [Prolixibacteraceae bacterium]|nr:hypothetical protein [Prolixibacteraceae bacterium]